MDTSLFIDYVERFMPRLDNIIEKYNGKRTPPTYYHKERLRTEYSVDQKWESASVNTSYVSADVVAMDSPLPLKMRDTLHTATGKLPKVGLKKTLKESQINAINIMIAQGQNYENVVRKLINDAMSCSVAIDEANEKNFLVGLSNGVVAVPDADTDNEALRLSFNYLPENSFNVETKDELELTDIKRVLDKADSDGNTITEIWIAKSTYDKLRQTRAARELVATYNGQTYTDQTSLPVPTSGKFDEAFADDTNGVQFVKVDRTVLSEKNGKRTATKPWNANKLIFTIGGELGALVWGDLAEKTNPSANVSYTTLDQYKLISKYAKLDPLMEVTSGQALVLPVIENVDQIYSLDISNAEEVDTTAEAADSADTYVTIWGAKYNKASFITTMKSMGISISANATDETVIKKVNALSAEEQAALKTAVASYKA